MWPTICLDFKVLSSEGAKVLVEVSVEVSVEVLEKVSAKVLVKCSSKCSSENFLKPPSGKCKQFTVDPFKLFKALLMYLHIFKYQHTFKYDTWKSVLK